MGNTTNENNDNDEILKVLFLNFNSLALFLHYGELFKFIEMALFYLVVNLGLIFKPRNQMLLWASVLGTTGFTIYGMPDHANHTNISLLLNIYCIVTLAISRIYSRPFQHISLKAILWVGLISYFMAGFHKLNADFFDPNLTCAKPVTDAFFKRVLFLDLELPGVIYQLSPWLAVIAEIAGPIFFLAKRTRALGLTIIVVLQLFLVPYGVVDFQSQMLATFVVFIPGIKKIFIKEGGALNHTLAIIQASFLFIYTLIYTLSLQNIISINEVRIIQAWLFNGVLLYLTFPFFRKLLSKEKLAPPPTLFFRPSNPKYYLHALLPISLFLFTITPYLGLRSAGNLTMFSNIITYAPKSNHYLIDTADIKIWDYEEDLVMIRSIHPRVRYSFDGDALGYGIPLSEFRKKVWYWGYLGLTGLSIHFSYQGVEYRFPDIEKSPWGVKSRSWMEYLLDFRKVPIDRPNTCGW